MLVPNAWNSDVCIYALHTLLPFLVYFVVLFCACCWVVCKNMQLRALVLTRKPADCTSTSSDAAESNAMVQLNK